MSISIQLNLCHKQVLIVGGGNVALRKCQQYVNEGAQVTVVAKTLHKEFANKPIHIIQGEFEISYLQHKFLVYAATDDLVLNEYITKLCDQYGILCGSATRSKYRSFSSMQQYHNSYVHLALSTNEVAVKLSKKMVEKGMEHIMAVYGKKLALLQQIKNMIATQTYAQIRGIISLFTEDKLETLLQMLKKKRVYVLVYHGVADENITVHDTNRFIKQIEYEQSVCISCVASKNVSVYCKEYLPNVFLFDEVLKLASYCKDIAFYFDIVLIREGRYFHKLAKQCKSVGQLIPFWFQKEVKKEYIRKICTQNDDTCCIFVLHDFDEEFHIIAQQYQGLCMGLKDEIPEVTNKNIHLVPVFMSKGSHFIDDVLHKDIGIYARLANQNYHITTEKIPIMEQAWFIDLYKTRLHNI